MGNLLRKGVRTVAGLVIALSMCWNFWSLSMSFGAQTPREEGEIVTLERHFLPIRFALFKEDYTGRNLGYVSARSPVGQKLAFDEGPRWSAVRYVAIPFILIKDSHDVPYVIGDFQAGESVPDELDGFIKFFDRGDGLVLYKRLAQ